MTRAPLRVAIDARLVGGSSGGIEQLVVGLASGLSRLNDGGEEYIFLMYKGLDDWLVPHIHGPCRILHMAGALQRNWRTRIATAIPATAAAWSLMIRLKSRGRVSIEDSDGTVERAGVNVMHFTWQGAFLTDIPSIYHPHDLQHLHFPQLFTDYDRRVREVIYRAHCRRAVMVATSSTWAKQDVEHAYGLPDGKVRVVPLAPPVAEYAAPSPEALEAVRHKYDLPRAFIYYPAQTWPHKNHIGLVRALGRLRREYELAIPLVCSGRLTGFQSEIRRCAHEEGVADLVRFLGFVLPSELACLYRLCRGVVIPTLFEAASFPLWEAFISGAPAACSTVTSLPAQAGDAAVQFSPHDVSQIADAVRKIWKDDVLRKTLVDRGRARVGRYTWDRTARIFRAHYRRVAAWPLTDDDETLLAAPPEV